MGTRFEYRTVRNYAALFRKNKNVRYGYMLNSKDMLITHNTLETSAARPARRALVPTGGIEKGLHQDGGVLLAVELASASPDSIVHPGELSNEGTTLRHRKDL